MRKYHLIAGLVSVLMLGFLVGANAPVASAQGPVETQFGVILDGSASFSSGEWTYITEELASMIENPDCFPKDGTVELTVVQFGGSSCYARLELGPVVIDSQATADDAAAQIRNISQLGGDSCLHRAIDLLANTMATAGYHNTGRRSPTANIQWLTYPTFTNSAFAYSQNNSGAQADDNGGGNDDYQQYYGYGFNIPSNAVIDGIEVRIRNYRVSYGESMIRACLSWDGGGNYTSTCYTTPRNYHENTWYDRNLGGSSNTWGRTWTASEINSGFRVRLRALDTNDRVCYIDWVAVRVYYHVPSNFHPDLKQLINIVTNSDPIYWDDEVEAARNNLLTTLAMTPDQDELDVEFFGDPDATSVWLRDEIAWPEPGYYAPPVDQGPGWVWLVTDDFEDAMSQKCDIITAAPVLTIDKECTPAIGNSPGDTVHCVITYENTGTADATNVSIVDDYDQTYGSVSNITGSAHFAAGTDNTDTITWGPATVPVDASDTVEYDYTLTGPSSFPSGTTEVSNTATINGVEDTETIEVEAAPVMTIDHDVLTDPPEVEPGGEVTYRISLVNNDTATATGVFIWATLPAGFTYASTDDISEAGGASRSSIDPTPGDTTPTWGYWSIPSGGSVTIDFIVDVDPAVPPGTYDSTAYADGDNFDQINDEGEVEQDADTPLGEDPEEDEDFTVKEPLPPPPPAPPRPAIVGGTVLPVNKVSLLMPWIGLAVALALVSVFVARFARRKVRG